MSTDRLAPSFLGRLTYYFESLNVTFAVMGRATGLSVSSLSRYRNGQRIPDPEGDHLKKLARGIALLGAEKGFAWTEESVYFSLAEVLNEGLLVPYAVYAANLRAILSHLSVKSVTLSRALAYDPSHVSRILSGTRRPADLVEFTAEVAGYFAERAVSESGFRATLEGFLALPQDAGSDAYQSGVTRYLCTYQSAEDENAIGSLLSRLSSFDLADFTRSLRFDDVEFPSPIPRVRSVKTYTGLKEMAKGEMDFLKLTLLSDSSEDVIFYSDMPMASMSCDESYSKQWMLAMAMLMKKGIRLRILHDLNRPLQEILLGIESYVPLYMTGLANAYYLPSAVKGVFSHHFRVSGDVALEGSAPTADMENGKYFLYKSAEEVARCRRIGNKLLTMARPVMDIYRADRKAEFRAYFKASYQRAASRRMVGDALPLTTMSEETLDRILSRLALPAAEAEEIRLFRREGRRLMDATLAKSRFEWIVLPWKAEPGEPKEAPALPLAYLFPARDYYYTAEEYDRHLKETRAYAAEHPNLTLSFDRAPAFRNLSYTVTEDGEVLISKGKSPTIHFVTRHPTIVNAFRQYIPPLIDE